ncbi:MAG: TonB-dependent receptor [Robiginitomaculum sp.]
MTFVFRKKLGAAVSVIALLSIPEIAAAQQIDEIIVTARKRAENLQDVPEAVTAFTARDIETAGIDDVADFIELTPNITIRETFRAGVTFITIRGITTGQQGWAPVTFVVDGVQASSLDAINQGALLDIERIEVLKGPQGALYGAGAIAGAINVVTKSPSDEFESAVRLRYAKGKDKTISGTLSGPIVEGKLRGLVSAYYRDADGLIDSVEGRDLDFEKQTTFRGRLIYDASDNLSFDLRGSYSDVTAGAAYQDKVFAASDIDQFNGTKAPGPFRGIVGSEDRKFKEISLKVDWETPLGDITSVSGLSDIKQSLFGSASWDNPLRPGAIGLAPLPLGGAMPYDWFQDLGDDVKSFTQDIRLTSSGGGSFRWLIGASYLDRKIVNKLNVGFVLKAVNGPLSPLNGFPRFDLRNDKAWGAYGQINYDVSERLELTLAGRYDKNNFDTTQYSDDVLTAVVTTTDINGNVVNTLSNKDDKFQPKATLSYKISDNIMGYVTYAEGFRYGFFNTGNLTKSESTRNYEAGMKTQFGAWTLNAAAFHIDYSNQQFTSVIAKPPFRKTTNIPSTTINGIEIEWRGHLSEHFDVFGGLGWLDAEQKNGFKAPSTPKYTFNLGGIFTSKMGKLDFVGRVDFRQQGEFYIGFAEDFLVPSKTYVNARTSIGKDAWQLAVFASNILNERQANDFTALAGGFVRAQSKPGSYGAEVSYKF